MPGAEQFGHYRIESPLGRGGMGVVHRAVDTDKDRAVALKRLPADLADDVRFVDRFRSEARLTATLSDPHVIPIHDYGEIDGRLYLDMRLVEGVDLESRLRDGPISPERTATIIGQVAGALDAAHHAGLVHRDVKPSNILLHRPPYMRDGESPDFAYLIDFGIAAAIADSRLTTTGLAVGTVAYMAPERFTAERRADLRADVYALGCVLHQCLTGLPPFRGDNMQLMYAHMHSAPPRPTAGRADLPPALDRVVATAMAKDPDRRYPRAGALAAALRSALTPAEAAAPAVWTWKAIAAAVRDAVARPATPPPPPRRTARLGEDDARPASPDRGRVRQDPPDEGRARPVPPRDDRPPPVAPGGGTRQAEPPDRPRPPESPVRRRAPEAAPPPAGSEPRQLPVAEAVERAAGVQIGRRARRRAEREVADPADPSDRPAPRPLSVPGRGHGVVALDPSGRWLATDSRETSGTVLWDLTTGRQHRRVARTLFAAEVSDIEFSPDGAWTASAVRSTASSGTDSYEVVLDAVDGSSTTALGHVGPVVALAYSPDGERLATASGDRVVTVWSTRTGRTVSRTRLPETVHDLAFSPDGTYLALAGDGVRLHDVTSPGEPHRRLVSVQGATVRRLSFSPDGRYLGVAGPELLAVVWDVAAGTEVCRYRLGETVRAVALSPDATRVALGNTVSATVWNVASSHRVLHAFDRSWVTDVAFDPTGRALAIASRDHDANVVVL